uniref:Uncharacterized protein n=1 Tax=Anguilla anguilla TaxID=7936 RepID=A0A0E9WRE5_ANGAN
MALELETSSQHIMSNGRSVFVFSLCSYLVAVSEGLNFTESGTRNIIVRYYCFLVTVEKL